MDETPQRDQQPGDEEKQQPEQVHEQQQPPANVTQHQQQVVVVRPTNSMGTAAGVLGIVGIVLIWVPFVGGLLCLLGLIFGVLALMKGRRENLPVGMAITGIATGGTGVLIYILVTLVFAVGSAAGAT